MPQLIDPAQVVLTVFCEKVLQHNHSAPTILEGADGATATVAVHDNNTHATVRREAPDRGATAIS